MQGFKLGLVWRTAVLVCFAGTTAVSKPLINSSEESYASVCLDYSDTAERLVEICRIALDQPGASASQRAGMLESLGYALQDTDRDSEAKDAFLEIVDSHPNDHRGWTGLGWLAHANDEFQDAVEYFSEALENTPGASALAGLTASQWETGDITIEQAVTAFDAALAMDPEFEWARRQKGWVLIDASRFKAAQSVFEKTLAEAPHDKNARAGLVRALIRQDAFEEALSHADRALADAPESYWFLSQRSGILYHLGRYRQSVREADRLISLDPGDSEGYVRKARAMVALGQGARALKNLAETEARIGRDDYLTYWRAELHLDQDEPAEALTLLSRTFLTLRADAYDLKLLARIHLARDDLDGARRAVDEALALRSGDAMALYYDAVVLLRQEQSVGRALEQFDEALAAGLSKDMIGDFASELYRAGFVEHAVAIRAKNPD